MKKFKITVVKAFTGWIEAKTEEEAVDIALDCFENEQTEIFIEDEICNYDECLKEACPSYCERCEEED